MKENTSVKSYIIGFIFSLLLTVSAFYLVQNHVNSGHQFIEHQLLIAILIGLALIQLVIQLLFFLHIGREQKPRWNLIMLLATFGIVLLVVIGSIWIMTHLNYNMIPQDMDKFLLKDEGIQK